MIEIPTCCRTGPSPTRLRCNRNHCPLHGNLSLQFQFLDPDARSSSCSHVLFAPMSLEGDAKAIDQSRSGEGLGQETNRPLLQRSGTSGLVGEGGDEYERHAITLCPHHRQELQSGHARHL